MFSTFIKNKTMKKLFILLIAALSLGTVTKAQSKTFVQAGVSTSAGQLFENVEVGAFSGHNKVSIVGESFDNSSTARQYFAGIKYARVFKASNSLDFLLTGAAKAHLDKDVALSVEPGVGLELGVGGFSVVGSVSSPLYAGTTPFKSLNLKGGLGVQVSF